MTCAGPFSTTDFVSSLFLVILQVFELQPSFQVWLRIDAEFFEFSETSSSLDEEMLRGIEEMEAELVAGGNAGNAGFSLCIAKISQGLRNFRNHSENFVILAKFLYTHFFAMIAKIRYHSENSLS